jgi:ABC-type transport system involved in multi-copper enzyme maturation permease subunit
MTLLPIVERELRVAARRRATYWSRVGSALVALGICTYIYLVAERHLSRQQLGMQLFSVLAWLSFLHCLTAGPRLTAFSVSDEKREGTLGLLFLTDLKGYDVVLGKLAASSVSSVYGLLAVFPVMAVTLLLGGVTARQFWSVALVLVNTLFLSLSTGMLFSTLARLGRRAAGLTFLFLFLLSAFPPLFAVLWAQSHQQRPILTMMYPSPGYALGVAVLQMFNPVPAKGFWHSVGIAHALAWGCLALASWIAPRVWQDRPSTRRGLRWRERWQQWGYGNALQRTTFRRRLLAINAFFWLAARDRLKPAYVWGVLGLAGAVWLWGFLYQRETWQDIGMNLVTAVVLHGILKFWLGSVAVQRLAEDRRNAALELLLSTPLTTLEIFRGQLRALWRQFGGPIGVVLVADLLLCYGSLRDAYENVLFTKLLYGAIMIMLMADAVTIGWLGMWVAVTSRHPSQAAGQTVARVLVLPWGAFLLLVTFYHLFDLQQRFGLDFEERAWLALWFVLGIANDVLLVLWSVRRLQTDFRARATQRFDRQRGGFWGMLFGSR